MENRSLRVLAPAGVATSQLQHASHHRHVNSKARRKPYIKNACGNCRSRKSRCDGFKPSCAKCQELGTPCFYTDLQNMDAIISLSQENKLLKSKAAQAEVLVKVMNLLRFEPARMAQLHIQRLRTSPNIDAMLDSIRPELLYSPSAQISERAVLPAVQSRLEHKLMASHSKAYPKIDSSVEGLNSIEPVHVPIRTGLLESTAHQNNSLNKKTLLSISEQHDAFSRTQTAIPNYSPTGEPIIGDTILTFAPIHIESLPHFCDPRLNRMNIAFWTTIPVTSRFAAGAISLFIETDHPSLGLFDMRLFIDSLLNCQPHFCSKFLVNALLAFASQGYTSRDPGASEKSYEFEKEAENLWRIEEKLGTDSLPTIAGLILLWFSHLSHGEDEQVSKYVEAVSQMAKRMRLFGVSNTLDATDCCFQTKEEALATSHAAWGAFNIITMQTLYIYASPAATQYPPTLPIPEQIEKLEILNGDTNLLSNMGLTSVFSYFCRLWTIFSKILCRYRTPEGLQRVPIEAALSTYQELLELIDTLPESMVRGKHSSSHPLVLHIWFHLVVLELFRPFIAAEKQHDFKAWSDSASNPEAIFAASLKQLKNLIVAYSKYHESTSSMFWNVALVSVVNAVLKDIQNPDWDFYFMLCIQCYQRLFPYYQAVKGIVQGLLVVAVKTGAISGAEAQQLMGRFRRELDYHSTHRQQGGYVLDLDLALTDTKAARVDQLMEQFEELALWSQYTNI